MQARVSTGSKDYMTEKIEMKKLISILLLSLISTTSYAACTGLVRIEQLMPREGGWVHIKAAGINDIDISNCGVHNDIGMLLNFSDTNGTVEGKKLMYSTLLTAFTAGKQMKLCSTGCDSQHTNYSRLSYINELQ